MAIEGKCAGEMVDRKDTQDSGGRRKGHHVMADNGAIKLRRIVIILMVDGGYT